MNQPTDPVAAEIAETRAGIAEAAGDLRQLARDCAALAARTDPVTAPPADLPSVISDLHQRISASVDAAGEAIDRLADIHLAADDDGNGRGSRPRADGQRWVRWSR
jgi:hypothetical protein